MDTGTRSGRAEGGNDPPSREKEEGNKAIFSQDESGSRPGVIKKNSQCTGSEKSTNGAGEESFLENNKNSDDIIDKNEEFQSGDVEELKFLYADNVGNVQQTKFADSKIDSWKCQALLPPVEMPDSSSIPLASKIVKDGIVNDSQGKTLGAGLGELHEYVLNTQDTLPSFSAAQEGPPGKLEGKNTATEEDGCARGRSYLPDIFSTVGKPLIQVQQPSLYVPMRSLPMHLASDTANYSQIIEGPGFAKIDEKCGSNLPKKTKKKKKKRKNQVVNGGTSEIISGDHDFLEDSAKLKKKSRVDGAESGINSITKGKQRPRIALGRWLKKKSNSVAPAPHHDSKNDAQEDDSLQSKKEVADDGKYTEHYISPNPKLKISKERSRTSLNNNGPSAHDCSTLLVLERKESVPKFAVTAANVINEPGSTVENGKRIDIENDNRRNKEHANYQPAVSVDKISSAYEHDALKESKSTSHVIGEKANATDPIPKASCCRGKDSLQTSLEVSDISAGYASKRKHKAVSKSSNAESVTKHNERRANRKKLLITLAMRSGLTEQPAVSRKVAKSKSCQKRSGRQQSKKNIEEEKFKVKKRVRFKLEPEIFTEEPSSATLYSTSYTGRIWVDRKPSTFAEQFRALTSTDCFQGESSCESLPIPDIKPK